MSRLKNIMRSIVLSGIFWSHALLFFGGCDSESVFQVMSGPRKAVTRVSHVNMRIAPFIQANKVDVLRKDVELRILGKSEDRDRIGSSRDYWYHVELESGVRGWIYGTGLTPGQSSETRKKRLPAMVYLSSALIPDFDLSGLWRIRSGIPDHPQRKKFLIRIFPDGNYQFENGTDSPVEGKLEVDHTGSLVRFSNPVETGESLHYSLTGKELFLTGDIENKPVIFEKFKLLPKNQRRKHYKPEEPEKEEQSETATESEEEAGDDEEISEEVE